ncbi:MAG: hypothetical protein M1814_005149 [Vezdaea aestivalis]|nr:MAG: hypothetical protein M1814_005149 [Vezdaea aestivalis]
MAPLSVSSVGALARLRAYTAPQTIYSNLPVSRRAAVLILLYPDLRGDLRVVLTMRSKTLKSFPGQAALPGGKADDEAEGPFETARREAFEEIGLPQEASQLPYPFRVEHLCELPTHLAKTELAVRPCVAFLHSSGRSAEDNLMPRLDAKEVAAVFSAPFHNFLRDQDETKEGDAVVDDPKDWYSGSWSTWHEKQWRMHEFFVPTAGQHVTKSTSTEPSQQEAVEHLDMAEKAGLLSRYRVWGMTAKVLVDAARVAYGEEPNFEYNSHHGDEDMIVNLQKMGRMGIKRKAGEQLTKSDMEKAAKM